MKNGILGVVAYVELILSLGSAQEKTKPAPTAAEILKRFAGEFVVLSPGKGKHPASFAMGSADGPENERPVHMVTLTKPFAVAKYEVTQELYQAIMGDNPSKWKGPRNSVDMTTWDEAVAFCAKVTPELYRLKLIKENDIIRLPSEAEWEYACRAGAATEYSFGNKVEDLARYGWYKKNAPGNDPPVGVKLPNPWGLYDMHGYVWEWCADAWVEDYKDAPADGGPRDHPKAKERVLRGGSFADPPEMLRSAYRHHRPADFRSDAIGFRCLRAEK